MYLMLVQGGKAMCYVAAGKVSFVLSYVKLV